MNTNTTELHKEIYDRILSTLEPSYRLIHVAPEDTVSPKTIVRCLERQSPYPVLAGCEFDIERGACADQIVRDAALSLTGKPYTPEEIESFQHSHLWRKLTVEVSGRDRSTPVRDVLLQTRVHARVTLLSNYDCWIPLHVTGSLQTDETALGGLMTMLSLNPAKVKEEATRQGIPCTGRWRKAPAREGREVVPYEDFIRCLTDCPNYALWTFFGTLDMAALMRSEYDTDRMIIPKGTYCTMFNDWNGGGSLSGTRTLRDISIRELTYKGATTYDRPNVEIDEKGCGSGYCSGEVYGRYLSNEYALTA